eukprot:CAMPEP_0174360722 /NCGR_PEP_ID=MMETSP0811_2-20130205/55712_1 /TAXON_ID=73025 ORGANISM="Eutreptiella gymnastica-like, Strain CCMP1594" /NCGR_SAMPLE_ID=MMETSP0811_2 /ASSEMBLY_ACC=CAM_ASM_000667 /LENGTH=77 /DNA_ID=CAMNT_0015496769 /DNA_START=98 /DNA_END=331 /DNA_ORIENTATION=-
MVTLDHCAHEEEQALETRFGCLSKRFGQQQGPESLQESTWSVGCLWMSGHKFGWVDGELLANTTKQQSDRFLWSKGI